MKPAVLFALALSTLSDPARRQIVASAPLAGSPDYVAGWSRPARSG